MENLSMALILIVLLFWSGWPGLNWRPPASKAGTLPTELHPERRAQRSDPSPGTGDFAREWAEVGRVHSGRASRGIVSPAQAPSPPRLAEGVCADRGELIRDGRAGSLAISG